MKKPILLLIFLGIYLSLQAQERRITNFPDIPGYQTLVCDFHMHTVFSDGEVWPNVRVDEAWKEGIDAIAITDHLEYRPHAKDISSDYNRSWEIAKEYARNRDVIVIAGTEITMGMPPGHLNALFIKDANPIRQEDYKKAVAAASGQGAFIFWNHPGWKAQQPDTMLWWEEHTYLLEQGWLHGIEVSNHLDYYLEAINWTRDKSLTFIANSDSHGPVSSELNELSRRTSTLVFVAERSEGGIREALFNGRTLALNDNLLMGREEILKAFVLESLMISTRNQPFTFSFLNTTDLTFRLKLVNTLYEDWEKSMVVRPGTEILFELPADTKTMDILVHVENCLTGSDMNLTFPLSLVKTVDE